MEIAQDVRDEVRLERVEIEQPDFFRFDDVQLERCGMDAAADERQCEPCNCRLPEDSNAPRRCPDVDDPSGAIILVARYPPLQRAKPQARPRHVNGLAV